MFVSQEITTEELRSRPLAVLQPTALNVIFNVLAPTGSNVYIHLSLALFVHRNDLDAGQN